MRKSILKKIVDIIKGITALEILALILVSAFFVRVYRVGDLLGFYYDQGRDALVIWRFWHEGKPFLIGPVTGLQGIYLGPFYYYLIAPLYLIGRGNPVWPAVFLAFLSTCSVLMLYILGRSMHSRTAGLIAATVGAFSYFIILHSRWLSNPNPILLSSLLLLYSMWKIIDRDKKTDLHCLSRGTWWIAVFLFAGISLHFEAASAVFYIPILIVFAIWQKKKLPNKKTSAIALPVLLLTFLPQILFNFRHENILLNNFYKLLFSEKAFRGITKFIFEERLKYFWNTFSNKIYAGWHKHASFFITLSLSALFVRYTYLKKGLIPLITIFLIVPIVGYTFFQGNHGNIYDYYLSGYFFPFILLFSIGLAELWNTFLGKIAVLIFFITFFQLNGILIRNYLTARTVESRPIALEDQLKAINWIINNAKNIKEFNVNVYVPPVIPYAYDYLFIWQATKNCGENLCGKVDRQVSTLYILYEEDPPHPERLEVWLERQKAAAVVEEETKFGMITVQRRKRF